MNEEGISLLKQITEILIRVWGTLFGIDYNTTSEIESITFIEGIIKAKEIIAIGIGIIIFLFVKIVNWIRSL